MKKTLREKVLELARALNCTEDYIEYLSKVRSRDTLLRRYNGLIYIKTFDPMNSDTVANSDIY